jgi:hypothetical protein
VAHRQLARYRRERLGGGRVDVLAGHPPAGAEVQVDDQQVAVGLLGRDPHDPPFPGDRVLVQGADTDRRGVHRMLLVVPPGEVEAVAQDRDRPDPAEGEPARGVEVERRGPPETHGRVDRDRGGHELVGVQAEHVRAAGLGAPPARLHQRPAHPPPPRPRLHPERPQPGPPGRPPEPLGGGVGIVGDRPHHPAPHLGHQDPPDPRARLDVEQLRQVPPEHRRRHRRRVLLVRSQQHPPNPRQVRSPGIANLDAGEAGCRHRRPTVPAPPTGHIGNRCLSTSPGNSRG